VDTKNLSLGQIVKSKSGRDKGWVFFIVSIVDENHVVVADGDYRRIENPKKKKIKHLQPYNRVSETIANKLKNGLKIENIELQRELEKSGVIEIAMEDAQSEKGGMKL